jgi:hypothetical protein
MASSLTGWSTSATSNTESYYGGDDRWIAGKRAWSFVDTEAARTSAGSATTAEAAATAAKIR